jgi:hypothetical protein
MTSARNAAVVPGIWLVGIGCVLLTQQASGWTWVQAWPLFVVTAGVCSALSAYFGPRWSHAGLGVLWGPLAVTVLGVVMLAATTGELNGLSTDVLVRWWPVAVIGLGVWFLLGAVVVRERAPATETLSIPLGALTAAEIRLRFGGGELRVGPADPGMLVSGSFEGGVVQRSIGPGHLELRPHDSAAAFWSGGTLRWDVGLAADIPVDLRLDTGANRSNVDLSALRIRRLELHTGASETTLRLPASGAVSARVEAGLASVTVIVPAGVAARVASQMAIGSTRVDESRFPRSMDGWASSDYESATNRVDITVSGGIGTVRVI